MDFFEIDEFFLRSMDFFEIDEGGGFVCFFILTFIFNHRNHRSCLLWRHFQPLLQLCWQRQDKHAGKGERLKSFYFTGGSRTKEEFLNWFKCGPLEVRLSDH